MKRLKRRTEISAMQGGILAVHQFHFQREHLPVKETSIVLLMAHAAAELPPHRSPAAHLNQRPPGVWM
jgi:hypothetical protein